MDSTKRSDLRKILGNALESASPASVIEAVLDAPEWHDADNPGMITVETTDGRKLRISTPNKNSSSRAELVSDGHAVDAAPSGIFKLANGKTLTIKDGRLTGGTAASGSRMADWAVFALLPSDREISL